MSGIWGKAPRGRELADIAAGHTIVIRARIAELPDLDDSLSADERARAAAFVVAGRRREFRATRSFLRRRLAEIGGHDPAEVRFRYGAQGKPELDPPGLSFNLSHSRGEALLALALSGEVGVDLEFRRRDRELAGIARRFFAPEELAALDGLEGAALVEVFYRIWTRKEAVLKATGAGVFERVRHFAVSSSEEPAILRSWEGEPDLGKYRLDDLPLGLEMAGALCRRGTPRPLLLLEESGEV